MKRLFVIIAIFAFGTLKLTGQNNIYIKSGIGFNDLLEYQFDFNKIVTREYVPAISLNIGITDELNINKSKSLGAGIFFSYKPVKQAFWISNRILIVKEDTSYYEYDSDGYDTVRTNNCYISLPLFINFYGKRKIGYNIGVSNNFLINREDYTGNMQSSYNLSLLFGLNCKINNRYKISLDLYADIIPYIKSRRTPYMPVLEYNVYNYGVMLSVSYKLFGK